MALEYHLSKQQIFMEVELILMENPLMKIILILSGVLISCFTLLFDISVYGKVLIILFVLLFFNPKIFKIGLAERSTAPPEEGEDRIIIKDDETIKMVVPGRFEQERRIDRLRNVHHFPDKGWHVLRWSDFSMWAIPDEIYYQLFGED